MREIRISEHTRVISVDNKGAGNANQNYRVEALEDKGFSLSTVLFQTGPIKVNGVNGVQNEDLIAIVIDRLEGFQSGNFSCRENALALTKLQEALFWLEHRTAKRKERGVEGTSII